MSSTRVALETGGNRFIRAAPSALGGPRAGRGAGDGGRVASALAALPARLARSLDAGVYSRCVILRSSNYQPLGAAGRPELPACGKFLRTGAAHSIGDRLHAPPAPDRPTEQPVISR